MPIIRIDSDLEMDFLVDDYTDRWRKPDASLQPSELASGLPTMAASIPGFKSASSSGMWAPAKTPTTIINRLNQEILRVINRQDVKEILLSGGAGVVAVRPKSLRLK